MVHIELVLFGLLVVVAGLSVLALRVGVPYPIAMVVGGAVLGFVPGIRPVELDPDLVLLVFLPPLLFHAASNASLRDLRNNSRAIMLNAVVLVLATMAAVAVSAHALVDGLPWAAAFALGAIISPTDPLAAVAIASRLGVPRRIVSFVEGESLVNDATALVAFRTSVAAVGGGFSLVGTLVDFGVSAVLGVLVGLVVARALAWVLARVDDDVLGVVISLICGFAAYLPAEELGGSGVLAAVACGLYLGRRSPQTSTAASRLRGHAFWGVLVFLLNAVLFVLVGMQLHAILQHLDRSALSLAGIALAISAATIGTRLVWLNTVPFLLRAIDRRPVQRGRRAGWRERLVVGWSGMRGSVSLAAALALPIGFPERDLLVFCAYAVIFATLVLQGLTLSPLVRALGIEDDGAAEREELHAQTEATRAALRRLRQLDEEDGTGDATLEWMTELYDFRLRHLEQRAAAKLRDGEEDLGRRSVDYQRTVRDVLDTQRRQVVALRDEEAISDEVMRRLERELDLEDERLTI